MKRIIVGFLVGVQMFCFLGLASAATFGQYSGVYDLSINHYGPVGQSFLADESSLETIAFAFSDMNPTLDNDPITMSLYEGSGFDGTIVNSVVQTLPAVLPGTHDTPQYFAFDFSGTSLTVGNTYTAAVTTSSSKVAIVHNGVSDDYLDGQSFITDYSGTSYDLRFYVTTSTAVVPIPSSALLLGTSLAGIAGVCRRKQN